MEKIMSLVFTLYLSLLYLNFCSFSQNRNIRNSVHKFLLFTVEAYMGYFQVSDLLFKSSNKTLFKTKQ